MGQATEAKQNFSIRQKVGLFLGPLLFLALVFFQRPEGLNPEGQKTLAVAALMACWWITEAIPIPATALIPLAAFPYLGIMNYREVAPNYGDNIIFLFMGGFFLAVTMQKWDLHKRLALKTVRSIGTSPRKLVLGFMIATAFISMMISNTSTTLLMYPIGLAVLMHATGAETTELAELSQSEHNFKTAMMLGIAYAASVGGIGTLIGTPPNVIFAGAVTSLYPDAPAIEFSQWLLLGIPLVVLFLPLIWLLLTRIIFPIKSEESNGSREFIDEQITELGTPNRGEKLTFVMFVITALALIFRRNINLDIITIPGWTNLLGIAGSVSDTTVIMSAAALLFIIPVDLNKGEFLLDWESAVRIPWGILILFGGGIALAQAFQNTGLAAWFGTKLTALSSLPVILVILLLCLMVTFMTEITSNTAMATIFMPILASTAIAMQAHPFLLMIPATISASCAFMMPVATPPNAIIFGSGYVSMSEMSKAGFLLNILGAVLITILIYFLAFPIFDLSTTTIPGWAQ